MAGNVIINGNNAAAWQDMAQNLQRGMDRMNNRLDAMEDRMGGPEENTNNNNNANNNNNNVQGNGNANNNANAGQGRANNNNQAAQEAEMQALRQLTAALLQDRIDQDAIEQRVNNIDDDDLEDEVARVLEQQMGVDRDTAEDMADEMDDDEARQFLRQNMDPNQIPNQNGGGGRGAGNGNGPEGILGQLLNGLLERIMGEGGQGEGGRPGGENPLVQGLAELLT